MTNLVCLLAAFLFVLLPAGGVKEEIAISAARQLVISSVFYRPKVRTVDFSSTVKRLTITSAALKRRILYLLVAHLSHLCQFRLQGRNNTALNDHQNVHRAKCAYSL